MSMQVVRLRRYLIATVVAMAVPLPANGQFLDFVVDEGMVPGTSELNFVADKISGAYTGRITFNASRLPRRPTFMMHAYADFVQYLFNEGTSPVPSQLGQVGSLSPFEYGLYALLTFSGTVGQPLIPGQPSSLLTTNAEIHVYVDPNLDTVKSVGATGADPITLTNTGDDFELVFASQLSRTTVLTKPPDGGFFTHVFGTPTTTALGPLYWPTLPPNVALNINGDFDHFALTQTQTVTGDVSAVFEP